MNEKMSRRTKNGPLITPSVRKIIEHLLEGKTFKDIAPLMTCKLDAVKIRIGRARKKNNLKNNMQLAAMVAVENYILEGQKES